MQIRDWIVKVIQILVLCRRRNPPFCLNKDMAPQKTIPSEVPYLKNQNTNTYLNTPDSAGT